MTLNRKGASPHNLSGARLGDEGDSRRVGLVGGGRGEQVLYDLTNAREGERRSEECNCRRKTMGGAEKESWGGGG